MRKAIFLLAAGWAANVFAATEDVWVPMPPANEVNAITIVTPAEWHLAITRDGGGRLYYQRYEKGGIDTAVVPARTFDFRKTHERLESIVSPRRKDKWSFALSFELRKEKNVLEQFTDDADVVRDLFDFARDRAKPVAPEWFAKLWKLKPPVYSR